MELGRSSLSVRMEVMLTIDGLYHTVVKGKLIFFPSPAGTLRYEEMEDFQVFILG